MVLPLAGHDDDERGVQRLTVIEKAPAGIREQTLRCGKIRAVASRPRMTSHRFSFAHSMPRCLAAGSPPRCCVVSCMTPSAGAGQRARRAAARSDRRRQRRRGAHAAPPSRKRRRRRYTVKRGDTLYQIALDHGLDYRELAAWNNIENVNVIRVGQRAACSRRRAKPAPRSQRPAPP